MTTKEKVIRQSLTKAEKRLKKLEEIQNANPASELMEVRKEACELLERNQGIEKRTSPEFFQKLAELSYREKKCWRMIERQKQWKKDSEEISSLTLEIEELKNELFYLQKHN